MDTYQDKAKQITAPNTNQAVVPAAITGKISNIFELNLCFTLIVMLLKEIKLIVICLIFVTYHVCSLSRKSSILTM